METSTARERATPAETGPALNPSQPFAPVEPSVAVLPFANLSAERENEYFSDGMTEELITALGKVEGLRVAARASSFAFKGKPLDVAEVSRALNVRAVLDGSVRRSGRRLRVTAELVDARDGSRLWADSYDRELRDVFRVQDELARAIVGALRIPLRLAARSDTALVRAATRDPEAHDLYLQGRFLWNQRTYESVRQAADFFERAAARDPTYAQAYAGLADTYIALPQYGVVRPSDAAAKARWAVERALTLDSTLAEAYASLAMVRLHEYDWRGAETAFARALALNPSYATAHQWYALYLSVVGRQDSALIEIERAQALDPLSRIISSVLGSQLALSRRYDDAIRQLRSTLELDPDFVAAHAWLCSVYRMKGDARAAITACERVAALTNRRSGVGALASAYAAAGDHARAMVVLHELEARARREYVSPWQFAEAHLGLGERDSTFAWLDSAYAAHDPFLLTGISSPLWDPVRSDPRFARLRARLGLPP
jgi:TolB-like protein/Tfp pilus assembly protein PilF